MVDTLLHRLGLWIVLLALCACQGEAVREENISATWEIAESGMSGTLALLPDKTFIADTSEGHLSGTWKIENDKLIGIVDESSVAAVAPGFVWTNRVTNLTGDSLDLENEAGETEHYRRAKPAVPQADPG